MFLASRFPQVTQEVEQEFVALKSQLDGMLRILDNARRSSDSMGDRSIKLQSEVTGRRLFRCCC